VAVYRGESTRALWVSSTSDVSAAVDAVQSMDGDYRVPSLLTWVDHLARGHRTVDPH
jgi:hypothetical protein